MLEKATQQRMTNNARGFRLHSLVRVGARHVELQCKSFQRHGFQKYETTSNQHTKSKTKRVVCLFLQINTLNQTLKGWFVHCAGYQ